MEKSIGIVLGIIITVCALTLTVKNTFVPVREQQKTMADSNKTLLQTLNTEINNGTEITTTK